MELLPVLHGHDPGISDNSLPVTASSEEAPELMPVMESGYSSFGANNTDDSEYWDEDQRQQTLLISINNTLQFSYNRLELRNDELISNLDSDLLDTVRHGNIETGRQDQSQIQAVYDNSLEISTTAQVEIYPEVQQMEESLPHDTYVPEITVFSEQEFFQDSTDVTPTMESGRIIQESNHTIDDLDVHSCVNDIRSAFYFMHRDNTFAQQVFGNLSILHHLQRLGRLPLADCISCLERRVAVQNLPCGCCCSCLLCAPMSMFCAQCHSSIQDGRYLN